MARDARKKEIRVDWAAALRAHVAKPSDLLPELQGRLPIRVELKALSRDDFRRILTEPEANLITQYIALMKTEGVDLAFDPDAIEAIAENENEKLTLYLETNKSQKYLLGETAVYSK